MIFIEDTGHYIKYSHNPFGDRTDPWFRIEAEFMSHVGAFSRPFTTLEQATGKKVTKNDNSTIWKAEKPSEHDSEIGFEIEIDESYPFIKGVNYKYIRNLLDECYYIAISVASKINNRQADVDFAEMWGRLCVCAGALQLIANSEQQIGHARSAKAGGDAVAKVKDDKNEEEHQRWFAHYFLRCYKHGARENAENMVEALINAIVDGEIPVPDEPPVGWYEEFIHIDKKENPDRFETLKDDYREDKLSVKTMKKLQKKGADGLPPVDLEFPGT